MTESNLHCFRKVRLYFTHLTTFYNEVTGLLCEGRAADTVYLEFSKAFASASHNILIDKLMKYELGKWTVSWTEIWPSCSMVPS